MKQLPNRITVLFVVLVMLSQLMLAGCWSRREIEDLNIAVGMALDQAEGSKPKKKGRQMAVTTRKKIGILLPIK